MPNREVSSLDRFVTTRGPVLAGVVDDSRRLLVLAIVSTVYGVLGAGFVAGAVASGALPFAINGGVFLVTGGVTSGIRLWLKSRLKPEQTPRVKLTPEATDLLRSLIAHVQGWGFGRHRRRRLRRAMRTGTIRSQNRCEDVLTPEAFRMLESAAFQYNRIFGVVGAGSEPGGTSFERFGPEILAAADATMAQLLDAAALANRLPETAPRLEAELKSRVQELEELAGEVERLQGASVSAPALAEGVSPVRSVLEELRADQRAREELRRKPPEPEEQRIELRSGGEG